MELKKRNVRTDNILRKGNRLGIYFLETGAVSHVEVKSFMIDQIHLFLKLI